MAANGRAKRRQNTCQNERRESDRAGREKRGAKQAGNLRLQETGFPEHNTELPGTNSYKYLAFLGGFRRFPFGGRLNLSPLMLTECTCRRRCLDVRSHLRLGWRLGRSCGLRRRCLGLYSRSGSRLRGVLSSRLTLDGRFDLSALMLSERPCRLLHSSNRLIFL